jgi:hypothetical protein
MITANLKRTNSGSPVKLDASGKNVTTKLATGMEQSMNWIVKRTVMGASALRVLDAGS